MASHEPREIEISSDPPQLEERLVAYLDGELDSEETVEIEQMMAADPKVRDALLRLERTWVMLDELGRAELDDAFAHSTLEMVAVAAEEDVERCRRELPRRRRLQWLIGSGGLLAAGLAGFLAVMLLRPDPNQQLLEDLRVIEQLDQLRQVDDVEFLRMMQQEGLFGKESADDA